jgi:hypothetical protein
MTHEDSRPQLPTAENIPMAQIDPDARTPLLKDDEESPDHTYNNDSDTYASLAQPIDGAPVENKSPLGYEVTLLSCVFLNLSQLIGVGHWCRHVTISHLQSIGRNIFCSGCYHESGFAHPLTRYVTNPSRDLECWVRRSVLLSMDSWTFSGISWMLGLFGARGHVSQAFRRRGRLFGGYLRFPGV